MKKILSFGLLALVLSMAPVAQSATIYDWTYTFSQDILTHDAPGSQGTGGFFENVNVESRTLTANEYGGYDTFEIHTKHSTFNQSAQVTSYMTFTNAIGDFVMFEYDTGITAFLESNMITVGPIFDVPDTQTFIFDGNYYQFGFRAMYEPEYYSYIGLEGYEVYEAITDDMPIKFDVFIESWPAEGPQPTPEPATMLLMGAGLAGLGAIKRRRNKHAQQ